LDLWHALAVAADQPSWLKLVIRLERTIGRPIESAVRSNAYFDLLTQANRTHGKLTRLTNGWTEGWLHLLNLPTGSDVRKLQAQLSRVERKLGRLAKQVEERQGEQAG
jgi:hypothetical protein